MRKILLVFLFLPIISFGLFAIEGNKIPIVTDQAELDLYIGKIITIEEKGEFSNRGPGTFCRLKEINSNETAQVKR